MASNPDGIDIDFSLFPYDMGQEKRVVLNNSLQAGQYQIQFDANDLSSGVYYYRLSAGNYSEMKRMTLLK